MLVNFRFSSDKIDFVKIFRKFFVDEVKKNHFSYRILPFSECTDFKTEFCLDFSRVLFQTEEDLCLENENSCGSFCFCFIFQFTDENNFSFVAFSSKGLCRVFNYSDFSLKSLTPWQPFKLNSKKPQFLVKICVEKMSFSLSVGKEQIFSFYNADFSKCGKFGFAIQNFCYHEKAEVQVAHFKLSAILLKNLECEQNSWSGLNAQKSLKGVKSPLWQIANSLHISVQEKIYDQDYQFYKEFSPSDFSNPWNFYISARENFILGNFQKSFEEILTCASFMSENLAVLELYAFLLLQKGEKSRAIRLIKSDMVHAPYDAGYAKECSSLIERLQNFPQVFSIQELKNALRFSFENNGIFPFESVFISENLKNQF